MFSKKKVQKSFVKESPSIWKAFDTKESAARTTSIFSSLRRAADTAYAYEKTQQRLSAIERKIERNTHFIFLIHLSKIRGCESTVYSLKYMRYYLEFSLFPTYPVERKSIYDIL